MRGVHAGAQTLGDLIGGVIGGIGSIFAGNSAAKKEKQAAQSALTGYNYLAGNPIINQTQSNALQTAEPQQVIAQSAQRDTLGGAGATQAAENQLLTSDQTNNPAFQNYLNSTGYNFNLQQGTGAINANAASKGLLNSGATAKALTSYGQNLGSAYFNNYLGQLGNLSGQQESLAGGYGNLASGWGAQVNQGLQSAADVGQAGTQGGNNAGNFQAQEGQSLGTSQANAFNIFGGMAKQALPNPSFMGMRL